MITLVNPGLYEKSELYNTNNFILNVSFDNQCNDITDNYDCVKSNHIGNHHSHCICNESSLEFNGETNFIEFVSHKCFPLSSTLAWGGWFLPIQCSKKQYMVYSKRGLSMFINEDDKLCVKLYTHYNCNYQYATFISKDPISINSWNYIICLYDIVGINYVISVYINNQCIEGLLIPGLKYPYVKGLNVLYLGYKNSSYYYKGIVNSFFITNEWYKEKIFDNLYVELDPPISHWNICNIVDSNTLYDIYGNNDGIIRGDVYKLNFGKEKQYIEFNSETLSKLDSCAFSISLSIYLNKHTCKNKEYILFSNLIFNKCNGYSITYVKEDTKNYVKFKLRKLTKNYIIKSPIPIEISKWNDILVTYNGMNCIQMYHNNKCVGIVNNIVYGISNEMILPTFLGGNYNDSFPGIINNIKVFNRLITNIEIKKLFVENYLS